MLVQIKVRDNLQPSVEENWVRIGKKFRLGVDIVLICEHSATFTSTISCSSHFFDHSKGDDLPLLELCPLS
jgi:hypothetical protein